VTPARRTLPADLATYTVLVTGAVLTLAPFLMSVATALKTPLQFASQPVLAPPAPITGQNFAELFGQEYGFVAPIVVTAQVVAVILVGQLLFSVFAGYAFARLEFPGRDALFWVYLATLMVPQAVTVIPLYTMLTEVGLRNTFWAPTCSTPRGSTAAARCAPCATSRCRSANRFWRRSRSSRWSRTGTTSCGHW
jgi:multiple sugar transport system permease protein